MFEKQNQKYFGIDKAWDLSKSWKRAVIIWRTLEHFFVVGSFAASVSVIYISAEYPGNKEIVIALSSIAAILTIMSFACNPTKYMTNYRMAFEVLNDALISNTDKDGNFNGTDEGWKEIIEAVKQGEKFIGRTYELSGEMFLKNNKNIISEELE